LRFQVVLPASTNLGACYSTYLQRDQAVQRANWQQDELLLTEDVDSDLLDAELYRGAPAVPDTDSELTRYLQQERLPRDTDIYQYWKAKQYDYPVLAKIAKDHLAIPAMSAPSEVYLVLAATCLRRKGIG
jgi:hypothetical protein